MLCTCYTTSNKAAYFSIKQFEKQVFTGQGVGKFNHCLKVKDTIDLLFVGKTRANHHFNPNAFTQKSFNTGVNGKNLAYSAAVVQVLPKNNCDSNLKSSVNPIAITYLKSIIEFCQQHNKSIVFVTTPIRVDCNKSDNEVLQKLMASLSVAYLDLSDFFKDRNNNDLWKDNTHLSAVVANKFSDYLADTLNLRKH